jgi:hypothetical protein
MGFLCIGGFLCLNTSPFLETIERGANALDMSIPPPATTDITDYDMYYVSLTMLNVVNVECT